MSGRLSSVDFHGPDGTGSAICGFDITSVMTPDGPRSILIFQGVTFEEVTGGMKFHSETARIAVPVSGEHLQRLVDEIRRHAERFGTTIL